MKKKIFFCFLMIFCLCGLFAKIGNKMYISVEKSSLKSSTSFFAKETGNVFYGDTVIILQEKDNWTKVRLESNSSVSGWINNSSLTKKKIVLSTNKVSVSTNELALAGKGFNAEIEAEYKKNGKVNYAAVDRLEKNLVSFDTVFEFMEAGKLLYQNLMIQLQGER